jgi:hypothetical protein
MQLTLAPAHDAKALERSTAKLASSLRSAQNCVDCGFHACRPVIPADAGPAFHVMPGRV